MIISTRCQSIVTAQTAGTANAALYPDAVLPHLETTHLNIRVLDLGGCFKLKSFAGSFDQLISLSKKNDTNLVVDDGQNSNGCI